MGAPSLEVLASAHVEHGCASDGYSEYTLWLHGKPLSESWCGPDAIAVTVPMRVDWQRREVMYRSLGLEVGYVPPVSFLEALPESLGDEGEDEQLFTLRALVGLR